MAESARIGVHDSMSRFQPPDADFDREITEHERTDLARLAGHLLELRPYPPPSLRGRVRSVLPRREPIGRPRQLWLRVVLLATTGAVLLLLVAAGLAGTGALAVQM
jgi:hypothetical protein